MNSPTRHLDTVQPRRRGGGNAQTKPADIPPQSNSLEIKEPPRHSRTQQPEKLQIAPSQNSFSPGTWIKRILSCWMFSLMLHCLLLFFLGSFLTNWATEESHSLTVTMVDDDELLENITLDISPMDLENVLQSEPLESFSVNDMLPAENTEPVSHELLSEVTATDIPWGADNLGDANMEKLGKGKGTGTGTGTGKGAGGVKGKVKFFGTESTGNRFIFVLDCSGSMSGERRFDRAVYELKRSIDMLDSKQDFLVILYSTETYPMLGMNENNIQLIPGTPSNKALVLEWLSTQGPRNSTKPLLAMRISLALQPSAIFLLSDGQFNDQTVPMLESTNVSDSSTGTKKIPINTITLGMNGTGGPTMQNIAKESGGQFFWAQ